MADHQKIYNHHADRYALLVSREDYQNNILRALGEVAILKDKDVCETGAGTGRLTCLLAPKVKSIRAYDNSPHMLDVARTKLDGIGKQNWSVAVGDHRKIPAGGGSADIALSGWSICYLVVWNPDSWEKEVEKALGEMERVLRPGGMMILLETLGTGTDTPREPQNMAAYYRFLEEKQFLCSCIRTDYRFESIEEAESLTRFFFGEEMVGKIAVTADGVILPECTGLWWKKMK